MSGRYSQARFDKSAPSIQHAPKDSFAEVAFAGRSNAGKSSAINAITGVRSLARTSKTPGRTQALIFFRLDDRRFLVDLPGYGYAKVSEHVRKSWHKYMDEYLRLRKPLRGLVLVMDIRHPLTEFDQQMLAWCGHTQLPIHVLLTKADKLARGAGKNTLLKVERAMLALCPHASIQIFSASKKNGLEQAHAVLNQWLEFDPS